MNTFSASLKNHATQLINFKKGNTSFEKERENIIQEAKNLSHMQKNSMKSPMKIKIIVRCRINAVKQGHIGLETAHFLNLKYKTSK